MHWKHAEGMSLRYGVALYGVSGKLLGAMIMHCCRIVNGIKNKKHKKQPWGNVECFAFGGATVRFASLETVSMPPTTQTLRHPLTRAFHVAPRIKTARRFTAKTPDDNMISWKKAESNLPNDFAW